MKGRIVEIIAVSATLSVVAGAWLLPLLSEADRRADRENGVDQVITLTAVRNLGLWTEDRVNAVNYWQSDLQTAKPVLVVDRPVLFRLQSADVIHTFYVPELDIGPLEVYPGKITEVIITPTATGTFSYYCTTVCGSSHFAMKGELIVVGPSTTITPAVEVDDSSPYWDVEQPGPGADRVEWGKWQFEQNGCATCHGEAGRRGVENHNGMNPEVLSLSPLASNLFLFSREDVEAFVRAIEDGHDLEDLKDQPPVPIYDAVLTQYRGIREVIKKGRKTVPMNPDGPVPPLDMPVWGRRISDSDIDAIFAYLLTANLTSNLDDSLTSRSNTGSRTTKER